MDNRTKNMWKPQDAMPGRQERINMARKAFGKDVSGFVSEPKNAGHSGRLFRWVTAGMLFVIFASVYYFDLSIGGIDRKWMEHIWSDTSLWKQVQTVIAHCVNYFRID